MPSAGAAEPSAAADHWASAAIRHWTEKGVFQGDEGGFRPDDPVTRAELAAALDRLFSWEDASDAAAFSDVPADAWYAPAVLRANAAGVLVGDNGALRPEDPVTRQEAVLLLARAWGFSGWPESGEPLPWTDAESVDDWALEAVSLLTDLGILRGDGGVLRPDDPVTRAELAVLLDRLWDYTLREPQEPPEVVTVEAPPSTEPDPADTPAEPDPGGNNSNISGNNGESTEYLQIAGQKVPVLPTVAVNSYDKSKFYKDDRDWIRYSDGNFNAPVGVDVSAWQGDIDWKTVRKSGVEFAIVRVGGRGYGSAGNLYVDKYYKQNIEGAHAAGLDVGVYFFSQATTPQEAVEEAELLIKCIQGYKLEYPVVYDWENVNSSSSRTRASALKNIDVTACALAFCHRMEQAGYEPMIYFNTYIGLICYDLSRLNQYDFWYAGYSSTPFFYYNFQIWQYTSSGSVPGIAGKMDLDLAMKKY